MKEVEKRPLFGISRKERSEIEIEKGLDDLARISTDYFVFLVRTGASALTH